uniref:NADH-ubiquinone oxidoreductase chain 6 n=1 Tax=Carangoides equula TaxID=274469 RepID=A0A0U1XJP7_CAREQ|nr:NADH dehydrogenase subunit 6 [Carangoides equula]AIU94446.1 NADH dehydrogenase subunit 6 [Carangoides equula]
MTIIVCCVLVMFVFGLVVVASNPSPQFAAFGLVSVAGVGSVMVAWHGGVFLGLSLFLIYLGGMLVVFAYTSALAAEPYPEILGSRRVALFMGVATVVVAMVWVMVREGWDGGVWRSSAECSGLGLLRHDTEGVAALYGAGGIVLVITALTLLLALFVVLELVRGLARGAMRAV